MKAGSTAHNEFKKIIFHINAKKDLQQMAGGVHTTLLEVRYYPLSFCRQEVLLQNKYYCIIYISGLS